jgi:hypothetical protein
MSETSVTVEPIRREVVVDIGRERAFALFTAEISSWWPAEHHIGSAPIEEEIIEPRVGGRWYTRHQDGTETSTGRVTTWDPPGRLGLTWQIGADWAYHDDLVTDVEVHFVDEGAGRTRVLLEHRGLEAYAAQAQAMREMFDTPGAWTAVIAAFAERAGRPS